MLYTTYTLPYNMKTTIQIDKETLEKLKQVKLTKRESYNEIIIRLLKQ